jgi:hypothetical protein
LLLLLSFWALLPTKTFQKVLLHHAEVEVILCAEVAGNICCGHSLNVLVAIFVGERSTRKGISTV